MNGTTSRSRIPVIQYRYPNAANSHHRYRLSCTATPLVYPPDPPQPRRTFCASRCHARCLHHYTPPSRVYFACRVCRSQFALYIQNVSNEIDVYLESQISCGRTTTWHWIWEEKRADLCAHVSAGVLSMGLTFAYNVLAGYSTTSKRATQSLDPGHTSLSRVAGATDNVPTFARSCSRTCPPLSCTDLKLNNCSCF